jgi:hypothetical protein
VNIAQFNYSFNEKNLVEIREEQYICKVNFLIKKTQVKNGRVTA